MATSRVRRAQSSDGHELSQMRSLLWPGTPFEEHLRELEELLTLGRNGTLPMAILVAEEKDGSLAGFLEVGLRSHADGCNPHGRSALLRAGSCGTRFAAGASAET
jgi:aminoglycoside 6'-N-acetyltransferase I